MSKPGKYIDCYEKYCSKCKHKEVDEHDSPCKECIDQFFKDRTFIHFEKAKRKKGSEE